MTVEEERARNELLALIATLQDDIAGYDGLIASERDARRKLDWMERRGRTKANLRRLRETGAAVEYDELTRMIYEIRSDVTIMKRQLDDHLARCGGESAGFPPNLLTLLIIGGVVTLLLLVFVVIRIGMLG